MANIRGTDASDTLHGGSEDDRITAKRGDDLVFAWGGNDTVLGGAGNDTLYGKAGDDKLLGEDGDDHLLGMDGADYVDGGGGNDRVAGGAGRDTLIGGAGADSLSGGADDDIADGGTGQDTIHGGDGQDTLFGGGENDQINGGAGDDYLDGGSGSDQLWGLDGADTIFGGAGNDTLGGGTGDDFLDGGKGNDLVMGNEGDDTLIGGAGDDTLYGKIGSDVFFVSPGNHKIIGGEDADGQDIDILDLTGAGDHHITYTGPESGIVHFFDESGAITHTATFKEIERVICFTPGTMIATMTGEKPVESLCLGDLVFTRDNGAQEIQWIGRKKITLGAGTLSQKLQPILIRKGALGYGLPERDLLVSPNHRVLLTPKIAEMLFQEREVLVAAKHLVGMPGIEHWIAAEVEYVHFLCAGHEVVLSNGSWTESFQPGDFSMGGLGKSQREEIFTLFPELRVNEVSTRFSAARKTLKRFEAELLVDLHQ